MDKLPISLGILAWKSGQTLRDSLQTYRQHQLLDMVSDITILFQEVSAEDRQIAEEFRVPFIGERKNIGIGKAFMKLVEHASSEHFILLEHDWQLVEPQSITRERLTSGLALMDKGFTSVRYRHRAQPGHPHFSFKFQGNELGYYDDWHECVAPHLLDAIHWMDPSVTFPDKIQKEGDYFVTTSRWGAWTNNPCMLKREFCLQHIHPFVGKGADLERRIAYWWPRQNFKVAHGEGLFKHVDLKKYGV